MAIYCPQVAILGFLPQIPALKVPSRHLGLVQAVEHPDLTTFVDAAATLLTDHADLDLLWTLAQPSGVGEARAYALPPLGQKTAVAQDAAFSFAYPDLLEDWRQQGAEIVLFSPLADQPPPDDCDAVYLPGGYPELSAEVLAGNQTFKSGVRRAAERGAFVYGECGGYMCLGQTLVDGNGHSHAMIGLLPVVTSMEHPKRHLGYRRATLRAATPFGSLGAGFRGHEFHYATEIANQGQPLFQISAANGQDLCDAGCRSGCVSGSYIHLISAESMAL